METGPWTAWLIQRSLETLLSGESVEVDVRKYFWGLYRIVKIDEARIVRANLALADLREARLIGAAMCSLFLILVVTASATYLAENEAQPEAFANIPQAMWWGIVTVTTVGYGDVIPMTIGGKLFGGLIGLIGIGMVALPAAIMASGFAENIRSRKQKYNQFARRFLKDGVLDETERWQLERLRRDLGLDSEEALELLHSILEKTGHGGPGTCPHCGEQLD